MPPLISKLWSEMSSCEWDSMVIADSDSFYDVTVLSLLHRCSCYALAMLLLCSCFDIPPFLAVLAGDASLRSGGSSSPS